MKSKYHIGLSLILLLASSSLNAQSVEFASNRHDGATTVVVNNYHNDYDYYYSSRINRFHRSYTSFNYYAPVFICCEMDYLMLGMMK